MVDFFVRLYGFVGWSIGRFDWLVCKSCLVVAWLFCLLVYLGGLVGL